MQKNKMLFKILLIISVVSTALAFKPLGSGTIYCFQNAVVNLVDQTKMCTLIGQPASVRIDYAYSTDPSHQTSNPCPANYTPFDGTGSTCIKKTPGTDRFVATLP